MFILLPFCGVIIREGLRAPRREALDDHKGAMNGLDAVGEISLSCTDDHCFYILAMV